jgi:hypothetical protein
MTRKERQHWRFRRISQESLDETRNNIRKTVDEVKIQIERNADVVNNYEEQTLNGTKGTAEACGEFSKADY